MYVAVLALQGDICQPRLRATGVADYVLLVDGIFVGLIEANPGVSKTSFCLTLELQLLTTRCTSGCLAAASLFVTVDMAAAERWRTGKCGRR